MAWLWFLTMASSSCASSDDTPLIYVTVFHAGEATNVIPDSAELGGTIRDLKPEVFSTICAAMKKIVESTAEAYSCESTVSIEGGFAETANPPTGVALIRKLAVEDLHSAAGWSPFVGRTLAESPQLVLIGGRIVARNGQLTDECSPAAPVRYLHAE